MDADKVPGIDGLPIEFYIMFYSKENFLLSLMKEVAQDGLSCDDAKGIISLMDKPGKNLLHINHWRPLSLLNVDAKIYSKILANRTYTVLPKLIHYDQTAFLKGRYIGENLIDLHSIIEHCNSEQIAALLVSIDFEKAFDTVSWEAFYKILEFYKFRPKYIAMVKNLFKNSFSCTVNHGYSSDYFQISCGLKQGDCYSPPAFLMVVEILGQKICLNERIEGIQIGKINKKHAQFTDDLWASILAKQTSIDALFDEIDKVLFSNRTQD